MDKFLLVYYGGKMGATPAEQKKSMDTWVKWFKDQGKGLVDMGAATMPGKVVSSAGEKAIAATGAVTGYSVIQAENMAAALKIAKTSPNVAETGSVAVYTILPM